MIGTPVVGRPALLVIDMQEEGYVADGPIPIADGYPVVVANAVRLVETARRARVPVIFMKEQHSRTHVDFGRELDGDEDVHDLEDDPLTELVADLRPLPDEYLVVKRRYSSFFGTDLEILLRGLGADTLVMCGGLTDVCVHYTFVDAHQRDYRARVACDAVIGSSEKAHTAALNAMRYLQRDALLTTTDLAVALSAYRGPPRPGVKPLRRREAAVDARSASGG